MNIFIVVAIFSPIMLVMAFRAFLSPFGWIRLLPLIAAVAAGTPLHRKRRELSGRLAAWRVLSTLCR